MVLGWDMSSSGRDELDSLLERALRCSVSDQTPPDRVWTDIRARVLGRFRQPHAGGGHLRDLGAEVVALGSGIVAATCIILTPSVHGSEEGWTERLVSAGHSSASLHYSIHY